MSRGAKAHRNNTAETQLSFTIYLHSSKGRKEVTVFVADLNDNAPEFASSLEMVTMTEGNSTAGKSVIKVNATDKDAGDNKRITYSITGGNLGQVFQIDSNTVSFRTVKAVFYPHMFYTQFKRRKDWNMLKVIPLKLFYYQTFLETWHNQHS